EVTLLRDSGTNSPREIRIDYRTTPAFQDHFIDFKVKDLAGVVTTSSVHRVLALSEFTSDRGQLDSTHVLPADQTIQITVTSSTPIDSTVFAFSVNGGAPEPPTSIMLSVEPPEQGGLRKWIVSLHK